MLKKYKMAIFKPKPSKFAWFGLLHKSPTHTSLDCIKTLEPNISWLGPIKKCKNAPQLSSNLIEQTFFLWKFSNSQVNFNLYFNIVFLFINYTFRALFYSFNLHLVQVRYKYTTVIGHRINWQFFNISWCLFLLLEISNVYTVYSLVLCTVGTL